VLVLHSLCIYHEVKWKVITMGRTYCNAGRGGKGLLPETQHLNDSPQFHSLSSFSKFRCFAYTHGISHITHLRVPDSWSHHAPLITHLQVIELCDLGNMSTALKNHVFFVPHPDKMLASVSQFTTCNMCQPSMSQKPVPGVDGSLVNTASATAVVKDATHASPEQMHTHNQGALTPHLPRCQC
jgi:hypothetical protein